VTLQLINPDDLPTPSTYTHVVVATGTRMVFIAGQEPEDVHGNLVGPGDLAAQARQVYANLGRALAAAGATCRSSSGPDNTCSASTSQPTPWWEWRRSPDPGT
jgi:enamine deaminase RidA (YjgF/YER057c/UK114 family)